MFKNSSSVLKSFAQATKEAVSPFGQRAIFRIYIMKLVLCVYFLFVFIDDVRIVCPFRRNHLSVFFLEGKNAAKPKILIKIFLGEVSKSRRFFGIFHEASFFLHQNRLKVVHFVLVNLCTMEINELKGQWLEMVLTNTSYPNNTVGISSAFSRIFAGI
jgi:hypothetical protein